MDLRQPLIPRNWPDNPYIWFFPFHGFIFCCSFTSVELSRMEIKAFPLYIYFRSIENAIFNSSVYAFTMMLRLNTYSLYEYSKKIESKVNLRKKYSPWIQYKQYFSQIFNLSYSIKNDVRGHSNYHYESHFLFWIRNKRIFYIQIFCSYSKSGLFNIIVRFSISIKYHEKNYEN